MESLPVVQPITLSFSLITTTEKSKRNKELTSESSKLNLIRERIIFCYFPAGETNPVI